MGHMVTWEHIPIGATLYVTVLGRRAGSNVYITIPRFSDNGKKILHLPSKTDWGTERLPPFGSESRFEELSVKVGDHFEDVYSIFFENWFDTVHSNSRDPGITKRFEEKRIDGQHCGLDDHSRRIAKALNPKQ